jgi:hypothetical protein
MTEPVSLGRIYRFMQRRVVVIQQWVDPFGQHMVRFRSADDDPEAEDGLSEADFLAVAEPLDDAPEFPE